MNQTTSTEPILPDLLSNIFQYLPTKDFLTCSRVNKTWFAEASRDEYWQSRAERHNIVKTGNVPLRTLYLDNERQVATQRKLKKRRKKIITGTAKSVPITCILNTFCIILCCNVFYYAFIVWLVIFFIIVNPEVKQPYITTVSGVPCVYSTIDINTYGCYSQVCNNCTACNTTSLCSTVKTQKYLNTTVNCCGGSCCQQQCIFGNGTVTKSCTGYTNCTCTCLNNTQIAKQACTLYPSVCYSSLISCNYTVPYNGEKAIDYTVYNDFASYNATIAYLELNKIRSGANTTVTVNLPEDRWYKVYSDNAIIALVVINIIVFIPLFCLFISGIIVCISCCLGCGAVFAVRNEDSIGEYLADL
jgi:hypothetical protein